MMPTAPCPYMEETLLGVLCNAPNRRQDRCLQWNYDGTFPVGPKEKCPTYLARTPAAEETPPGRLTDEQRQGIRR
ncbi:MAG TPA: hypothetical protein VM537_13700 [Anaerolineae bacterium]|nr:hypothetical protein [Anaerolineae bacterium]